MNQILAVVYSFHAKRHNSPYDECAVFINDFFIHYVEDVTIEYIKPTSKFIENCCIGNEVHQNYLPGLNKTFNCNLFKGNQLDKLQHYTPTCQPHNCCCKTYYIAKYAKLIEKNDYILLKNIEKWNWEI